MKSFFILLVVLITLALPVFSYYAGETTIVEQFSDCTNMTINVTGILNIDTGEYELINCTALKQDYWYCECDSNNEFDLTIKTLQTTLNNYTFNYTYDYKGITEGPVEEKKISSNRGGNSCRPNYVCGDWSGCNTNGTQIRLCKHEGSCSYRPRNETQECTGETIEEPIIEEIGETTNENQTETIDPGETIEPTEPIKQTNFALFILLAIIITIIIIVIVIYIINTRS